MDLRRYGVLVLLCLAAVGCRKDPYMDAYFELLNSEKRVLEDRLYELEYDYQKALKELEEYRDGQKQQESSNQLGPEPSGERSEATDDGDSQHESENGMELDIPDHFLVRKPCRRFQNDEISEYHGRCDESSHTKNAPASGQKKEDQVKTENYRETERHVPGFRQPFVRMDCGRVHEERYPVECRNQGDEKNYMYQCSNELIPFTALI